MEENPLKSCLSVSRVELETGTPGGGWMCLSETRVLVSLSEVLVSGSWHSGLRSGFESPDLDSRQA